ncbi:MAG TPA: peptidylprolyl isomerase [Micropepsaceae bacterium]|nr:peptidylprolyl isomerase [Micropepsaceae bacterium]
MEERDCSSRAIRWAKGGFLCLLVVMVSDGWFSIPQGKAAEGDPSVIARLGTTEFHAADFANFVRLLDPDLRKKAMADPQAMNKLMGLELARIAVLSEARARNWQQRPAVTRQIERARDDVIVNSYLASVSSLPKDFPSAVDIQAAYDLNRDNFMAPRQYRLAQIFVASPQGIDKKTEEAAKKKADDLARKAKAANAKFDDLARTSSEHKSSAALGGDMGWAASEQIVPEIRKEVVGMEVGEVSGPIRSAAGWHIVRLAATRPAAPRPLAEVKETLVAILRHRKTKDNQQAYVAKLLDKNHVAVNEAGLRKLFESVP